MYGGFLGWQIECKKHFFKKTIFDPNGPPGENWYFLAYFGIVPLEVDEYVLPMIEHVSFAVCFKTCFKKCFKTFLDQIFSGFFLLHSLPHYPLIYHTTLSSYIIYRVVYHVIWLTMAVFEATRGLSSSLKSCLELFSLSELFFGDRCKRSLIYRVLTAKNMRPYYHVTCVKIEFFIHFLMSFSVNTL